MSNYSDIICKARGFIRRKVICICACCYSNCIKRILCVVAAVSTFEKSGAMTVVTNIPKQLSYVIHSFNDSGFL